MIIIGQLEIKAERTWVDFGARDTLKRSETMRHGILPKGDC